MSENISNRAQALKQVLGEADEPILLDELFSKAQELHPVEKEEQSYKWKFSDSEFKNLHRIAVIHTPEGEKAMMLGNRPGEQVSLFDSVDSEKIKEESGDISSNGIPILGVKNASNYYRKDVPEYVKTDAEYLRYKVHLQSKEPILLRGPKGIGKTLSLAAFAKEKEHPIIQFDCSENTRRYDLIGRFVMVGEEVKYQLGVLPRAIQIANKEGSVVLVLEELNALTQQMQKVLNQLLDWRGDVYIPELGKTFKLKEDANILIAATMNPQSHGGTFALNEDLKDRFSELQVWYPSHNDEREILSEVLTGLDSSIVSSAVRLSAETRSAVNNGDLSFALSPRSLIKFGRVFKEYRNEIDDVDRALKLALEETVLNRYDNKQERETVKRRIHSCFSVTIGE